MFRGSAKKVEDSSKKGIFNIFTTAPTPATNETEQPEVVPVVKPQQGGDAAEKGQNEAQTKTATEEAKPEEPAPLKTGVNLIVPKENGPAGLVLADGIEQISVTDGSLSITSTNGKAFIKGETICQLSRPKLPLRKMGCP